MTALYIFYRKLSDIVRRAEEFSQQSVVSRFFQQGYDKAAIDTMKEDLKAAISYFNVCLFLNDEVRYLNESHDRCKPKWTLNLILWRYQAKSVCVICFSVVRYSDQGHRGPLTGHVAASSTRQT